MTGNTTQHERKHDAKAPSESPALSIIVPILDEKDILPDLLTHLQHWQHSGCEIVLVDGGSIDGSAATAQAAGFAVFSSDRGRALQMNAGAAQAHGRALVFLHADTRLPANAPAAILKVLATKGWGRFDVTIEGTHFMLPVISALMNLRSRWTGIATGDQAIFVRKDLFNTIGGFPRQPLMEDIEISKYLKRYGRPGRPHDKVVTSGRRWLTRGVWRTIILMWRLRFLYWCGVSADQIGKAYR